MSRAVVVLCFVLFVGYVAGNLIRQDDVTTKEVKILRDDMSSDNDVPTKEEGLVDPEKNDIETTAEVLATDPLNCRQIGESVSKFRRYIRFFTFYLITFIVCGAGTWTGR